jgi:hypothetical protein
MVISPCQFRCLTVRSVRYLAVDRSVNEGQLATPLRSFKVRIDCAAGDLTCTGR